MESAPSNASGALRAQCVPHLCSPPKSGRRFSLRENAQKCLGFAHIWRRAGEVFRFRNAKSSAYSRRKKLRRIEDSRGFCSRRVALRLAAQFSLFCHSLLLISSIVDFQSGKRSSGISYVLILPFTTAYSVNSVPYT